MERFSNLSKRVGVAAVAIPLLLIAAERGDLFFLVVVSIIAVVGLLELFDLCKAKGYRPQKIVGIFWVLSLLGDFYVTGGTEVSYILIAGTVVLLTTELFAGISDSHISNIGVTGLGILYIGFTTGSLVLLRQYFPLSQTEAGDIVVTAFLLVWGIDTAAYFVGKAHGKRKLWPRVSPSKSVEGAIAGLVASVLIMIGARYSLLCSIPLIHCIVLGILIGIGEQVGDLAESLLKRDAGVKDSSSIIPGHGGMLDRFDSLFFTGPIMYLYFSVMKWLSN